MEAVREGVKDQGIILYDENDLGHTRFEAYATMESRECRSPD
jgi:hypothetical protein